MAHPLQFQEFNILGLSDDTVLKLRTAPLDRLKLSKMEICRVLEINNVDFKWRDKKGSLEQKVIDLMLEKPLPGGNADQANIGQAAPLVPVQGAPNDAEHRAFMCHICMERDIHFMFSLCGHLGVCTPCKIGMTHEDILDCPACRRQHHIENMKRVFLI